MVARKFLVRHSESTFDVDYDTDDGFEVFKFQLFSLTSVPPEEQRIREECEHDDRLITDDEDLAAAVADKLILDAVREKEGLREGDAAGLLRSDEELARLLQEEEEALMLQEHVASEGGDEEMERRLRPYISRALMYEDPTRQEAARKTVPVVELEEKALISLAKEGNFKPSKIEQDHAFLLQLLFWFKQSFRWVNAPPCDVCGNNTVIQGMGVALPSEIQYGADRVELYSCTSCSRTTRFPRYNDPLKLLETRRGRCGEWANCFTLYCRAFGYESRLILDFTDHVWTECFSNLLGRWMHLDPCEGVYDKPLLYEKGWNKKLNYAIGIAKDGVYDVTKRYTRKWPEVLSRRNITTEPALTSILSNMTKNCRRSLTSEVHQALENRDKVETYELEGGVHAVDNSSISLPGRQSGDKEWRISRSEIGSDENCSLSSSSCPIRVCVDEHVTKIYSAFLPLLSKCIENSLSESRVIEILKLFQKILMDLKTSNYKTRRASINPFMLHLLPYFEKFLDALSLKSEIGNNGDVDICLVGDPVHTSLALPIALDSLDEMISTLDNFNGLNEVSLSFPLLKLNRIHSGSVLASGEELPFGTATAAFDGLRLSKWEEPNGAKGCWIVYKLSGNGMHELAAYDIMSANDAPERDPKDWVVEGSVDGGSSWHVLDTQTSQEFENRFQRRSFKVRSVGRSCNAFRFRFLSARDSKSNTRVQLASIDLYARSSQEI